MYSNSYITSSYAVSMMCGASAPDARVQFLRPLVKPGKVLLTNCGISIAYRIYLVMPNPGRFPDVILGYLSVIMLRHWQCSL
jgi:hypothetical protein